RQGGLPRHVADALLIGRPLKRLGVVGPLNGADKAAKILLLYHRIRHASGTVGLDRLRTHRMGVINRQDLREPTRSLLGSLVKVSEMIRPTRRRNEQRPTTILSKDRPQQRPSLGIGNRKLAEHNSNRVSPDE